MKKALFTLFVMFNLNGICFAEDLSLFDTSHLRPMNFFEGTVRRDMKDNEKLTFLQVIYDEDPQDDKESICSGFRVQQKNNRFFVATSRHCFKFDEVQACEGQQIKIATADSSGGNFFGTCKKVIASSDEDDLVIMEFKIASSSGQSNPSFELRVKELFPSYNLASYFPVVGTPLVISGFPADPARQTKATITENCEILPSVALDAIYAVPIDERVRLLNLFEQARSKMSQFIIDKIASLNVTLLKHNCSVYEGNSGGPARIEGTKDIVGIPHDSWFDLLQPVPRNFARNLEATATFVRRHREILETEGVVISDIAPKVPLRTLSTEHKKIQSI